MANSLQRLAGKAARRFGVTDPPYAFPRRVRGLHFYERCREVGGVAGAVVECGVGRGDSLTWLLAAHELLGVDRRFYAFDTFAGLNGSDPAMGDTKPDGAVATTLPALIELLKAGRIPDRLVQKVTFVPGDVRETARAFAEPIALLHLHLDIHAAYQAALRHLYDRVVPGGIVMFDEYSDPKWTGARTAIDDFLGARVGLLRSAAGKAYLVKPA